MTYSLKDCLVAHIARDAADGSIPLPVGILLCYRTGECRAPFPLFFTFSSSGVQQYVLICRRGGRLW